MDQSQSRLKDFLASIDFSKLWSSDNALTKAFKLHNTTDQLITILGNDGAKLGTVHASLLLNCSTYFSMILNSKFREGTEKVYEPDENNIEQKHLLGFMNWLYCADFKAVATKLLTLTAFDCCLLWIFGDIRGMATLQNDIVDFYVAMGNIIDYHWPPNELGFNVPSADLAHYVYKNTDEKASLRLMLCDEIRTATINYLVLFAPPGMILRRSSDELEDDDEVILPIKCQQFYDDLDRVVHEKGTAEGRLAVVARHYHVSKTKNGVWGPST